MAEIDPGEQVPGVAKALEREGLTGVEEVSNEPLYKLVAADKIPVSRELGKLWQSRLSQARAARRDIEDCWSEAIRYYENDQMANRTSNEGASGRRVPQRISDKWSETENIVFSNATTLLPMLYAKNPTIEVTPTNTKINEGYAKCVEKLINTLFNMKDAPGVKLKPSVRRGILWCLLTNSAYMRVGITKREEASETAIEELQKLSTEYANAKDRKTIQEIEGKLQALEERISLLQPSGPFTKLDNPFDLFIDPTSTDPDHSDATWIIKGDYLPTTYLNAVYGKNKDGKIVSVYEPTHVLKVGGNKNNQGHDDEINNFSLLNLDKDTKREASHYGYESQSVYEKCQYTRVYWVWDKTTRRVLLFADNNWQWPIWVWNDPLKLMDFYPWSVLHFHESVDRAQSKGETTYYLDQQDAINEIHSTIAQARRWAKHNILYNKNMISQADVEAYLKGPDGTARGIDLPEGMKIGDAIFSTTPPSMQFPQLFDTATSHSVIDRITGITAAQRGAEFKVNTTNDAINFYQRNSDIKIDEKIDAIEEWIGDIAWKLLQILCVEWTREQVIELIGEDLGQFWMQLSSPSELRSKLSVRVVGGSTDKPTSTNKKRMVLEVGQVMGQFGGGIPAVGIVILRAIERAFNDDIIITDDDWKFIYQSIAPEQPQQAGGGGAGPDQQQVAELVSQLPRELQVQLKGLLDQGVPPEQALQQIQQMAQQTPPDQQQA